MQEPDVFAINVSRKLAILTNDEVIPLHIVREEDETRMVAGPDSRGKWYAIDNGSFERHSVH